MKRSASYFSTVECNVRVPTPSPRYLNEFFALKCASELAPLFPNAKEVTESFSLFAAAKKHLGVEALREPITLVCPGDGTQPRTAALFVLRSRWTGYSVDPIMRPKMVNGRHFIDRLKAIKGDANTFQVEAPRVVVASCHAHSKLSMVLAGIKAERIDVFSLPCCIADDIGAPTHSYLDTGCWSPQNRVNVYLNYGESHG